MAFENLEWPLVLLWASQVVSGNELPAFQSQRCRFDSWMGKIPGEGNSSPFQYSCLGNSMDRGGW